MARVGLEFGALIIYEHIHGRSGGEVNICTVAGTGDLVIGGGVCCDYEEVCGHCLFYSFIYIVPEFVGVSIVALVTGPSMVIGELSVSTVPVTRGLLIVMGELSVSIVKLITGLLRMMVIVGACGEGLALVDGLTEAEIDELGETEGLLDELGEVLGLALLDGEILAEILEDGLIDGLTEDEGLTLGEAEAEGLMDALILELGEMLGLTLADGLVLAEGEMEDRRTPEAAELLGELPLIAALRASSLARLRRAHGRF